MMKRAALLFLLAASAAALFAADAPQLLAPEKNEAVSLLRSDWKQLTGQRKVLAKTSDEFKKNLHFPLTVRFAWRGGRAPYRLELAGDADRRSFSGIGGAELRVANLFTGTDYRWSVTDAGGRRAEGAFSTMPGPRLIQVPEAAAWPINVRDIGGRRSVYGGVVRQGLVYRGSHLKAGKKVSEKNLRFFVDGLKIRTELDLRYAAVIEREKCTASNIAEAVRWVHVPVNAYKSFTPEQNALFRDAVRLFADKTAYPVYVHCQGGVDRTGEICFLLNAVAGVSDDDLLTDYELSSLSKFPRSREKTVYFCEWRKKIGTFSSPDKPYSEQVVPYLLSIGVTQKEIDAIRGILLGKTENGGKK